MLSTSCDSCGNTVPLERNDCPHCGQACRFPPNVRAAQADSERQALDQRYRAALSAAAARGAEDVVRDFDEKAKVSKAVCARPLRDVERLASSDRELYPTFYGLTEGEVRLSFGDKWDRLRRLADAALFPGYEKHMRFAALSLDGLGLTEFGDCFLVLREDMIAQRATAFEENSASSLEPQRYQVPEGCRAIWEERSKLCTAKNAGDLMPGTPSSEFPALLMRQKSGVQESRFVEVHIYGSMSVHTVESVILRKSLKPPRKSFALELRDRLRKAGVELEVK